ncbi:MAG TPA: sigma factor-like helix-turn-helix DNA-binding protein [Thermoanaerobaculaceae bacterium]|nr:sigma factor-like helix-turn-helix DNA-binding protein [Thermoanaerobaculaceae bacterium]
MEGQAGDADRGDSRVRGADALTPEALEELRRRIVAAVRRSCPTRLAAEMEDIVQTILARLILAPRTREGNPAFSSMYLAKAAYGATVDELRRLGRRREDSLEALATSDSMAAPDAGPERVAASAEIARGIRECLAGLARPRRLAVTLYIQGCTVPEAAGLLRWSLKKTENLVYRGLADLRRCLATKGLQP